MKIKNYLPPLSVVPLWQEKSKNLKIFILSITVLILINHTYSAKANITFPDIPTYHQNYQAINYLQENNILNGYPDGYFRPENPVSRVELLKIVMNASGIDSDFDSGFSFSDIDKNMWYAKYVSEAYKRGHVNGNSGRFYPNNTVTKAEALKIIMNIKGVAVPANVNEHPFADVNMNQWYAPFFQVAKDNKYLDITNDEKINPHDPMTRGEVSEIIYRILTGNTDSTPPPVAGKIFRGPGTYTVSIGDKLYDELNGRYIHFISGSDTGTFVMFNTLDREGNILLNNSSMNYSNDTIYGNYELSSVPLEPQLMNHNVDGIYIIKNMHKVSDQTYRLDFEYALQKVREKARGVKKILFVPIYLSDEANKISDHNLRMQYVVEPALNEIKAYIKTKQLQYLGEEIMWFDFTITDPVIPPREDSYYYGHGNEYEIRRFDMIKDMTPYNPEDFDIVFQRIYTNSDEFSGHYAAYHRAQMAMNADSITEWDLSSNISLMQQRSNYNDGGLHEILHNLGMSDLGKNQGKNELYIGNSYDGSQLLCTYGINCPEYNRDNGNAFGFFQYIDSFIAHEIGWTDRNSNGILDVDEYTEYCDEEYKEAGYDFCK